MKNESRLQREKFPAPRRDRPFPIRKSPVRNERLQISTRKILIGTDKRLENEKVPRLSFDKENVVLLFCFVESIVETTYHLSIRTSHIQEEELSNHESFYVQLEGEKGSTEKLFLVDGKGQINLNKSETSEIDFRLNDLGKLRKLVIGQEQNSEKNVWHVEHVVVKHAENVVT